eukprot:scaffold194974_cov37-Tisochrysis_lutea.AAC.1
MYLRARQGVHVLHCECAFDSDSVVENGKSHFSRFCCGENASDGVAPPLLSAPLVTSMVPGAGARAILAYSLATLALGKCR